MQDLKVWAYDDIFNPVTDLNDNFATVKNAIESLEGGAETDEQDISDLKTKVGSDALVTTAQDLSGAVNELDDDLNHASTGVIARLTSAENNIGTLQTQAGNATLVTTAQTLSGAINELDDDLNHADTGLAARVTDLETQAGSATLETTAQTLSGAINELDDDLNHADTGLVARVTDLETQAGSATLETTAQTLSGAVNELLNQTRELTKIRVSADGVKTWAQIMEELATQIVADSQNNYIELLNIYFTGYSWSATTRYEKLHDLTELDWFIFNGLDTASQALKVRVLKLKTGSCSVNETVINTDSTITHTDLSAVVPTTGEMVITALYS